MPDADCYSSNVEHGKRWPCSRYDVNQKVHAAVTAIRDYVFIADIINDSRYLIQWTSVGLYQSSLYNRDIAFHYRCTQILIRQNVFIQCINFFFSFILASQLRLASFSSFIMGDEHCDTYQGITSRIWRERCHHEAAKYKDTWGTLSHNYCISASKRRKVAMILLFDMRYILL